MRIGTDARKKVQELIKDVKIAMLATRGDDGRFHARPMWTSGADFDGTLWFLTDRRTHKVDQLQRDGEVLVTYADEKKSNYVSIAGQGELVDTKETIKRIWSEAARPWFPKGIDDPNIVAMKIDVDTAEYWDVKSATLVMAFGYLKAVATGKRTGDSPLAEHGVAKYS